jgi:hypothetical protein
MSDSQPKVSSAFQAFMSEAPKQAQAWMALVHSLDHASALDKKTEELPGCVGGDADGERYPFPCERPSSWPSRKRSSAPFGWTPPWGRAASGFACNDASRYSFRSTFRLNSLRPWPKPPPPHQRQPLPRQLLIESLFSILASMPSCWDKPPAGADAQF